MPQNIIDCLPQFLCKPVYCNPLPSSHHHSTSSTRYLRQHQSTCRPFSPSESFTNPRPRDHTPTTWFSKRLFRMIFTSSAPPVEHLPDDISVYDFLFHYFPNDRPDLRNTGLPLLIDEITAQKWTFEETRENVDLLSIALKERCGLESDAVASAYATNSIYLPVAFWATHRVGATVSPANPAFLAKELAFQLEASRSRLLFVSEDETSLKNGFDAAKAANIPRNRVVIIQEPTTVLKYSEGNYGRVQRKQQGAWTLAGLIEEGRDILKAQGQSVLTASHHKLKSGEAHTKLAFLSFSSGTTGLPKGVAIQHFAVTSNALQTMAYNEVGNTIGASGRFCPGKDVSLGVLPQVHIFGLSTCTHFTFYAGIANLVMSKFRGIENMIKTIIKFNISVWWLVPPQIVLFCKDPSVPPYLEELQKRGRVAMVGAAPLSDDLSRQFTKIFPKLDWGQGSGMTETCSVTTMFPPNQPAAMGSAGRLISNTEAKVVNSEGKEVGYDELGELWLRGPQITLGYTNNRQATEECFLEGGWLRTGDEVKVNRDGDIYFIDRLKELIKVKGFQVAPAELEGFLLDHPDVSDCGVIGIQDEAAGELPFAFISLSQDARARVKKEGQQEEERIRQSILKFVADNKVRYKHLCGVTFIDLIPKTASGKILRRQMRDMAKKLPSETFGEKRKIASKL
ncbi:acetyl-CoA synthetase-like protein [Testicularia cyperi]|uniref:Acetyl-CoA synthetase-like protein n=1 Tax=Testicularia cyperi TaxID=1882483 RepID=A0A317XTW8_9BASI|nr:acetyl-CoA synthetase-like protein [Testicularia cyperi]